MLSESIISVTLIVYLAIFFTVNVHNVIWVQRGRTTVRIYAEEMRPKGFSTALSGVGTLIFFSESILYPCLSSFGFNSYLHSSPLQLRFPCDTNVQILGIAAMSCGYFIFLWSVISRGRYSVSWEMPEDHRLVTWGPYQYVRHPSYLGYFLMFGGLFLLWLNLVAAIPLVAIPGYMRIAVEEENLLIHRFGDDYLRYQKTTGKFLPKLTTENR